MDNKNFSYMLKQEISCINNLNKKEEVLSETYGIVFTNKNEKFSTKNEYVINRYSKDLENSKILNFKIDIKGNNFIIIIKNSDFKKLNLDLENINFDENFKFQNLEKDEEQKEKLDLILKNELNKKAFIRGCFLSSGIFSEPTNIYKLEIIFKSKKDLLFAQNILKQFEINSKILEKDKTHISLYMEKAEDIRNFLAFVGASKTFLKFEDLVMKKQVKNKVNLMINYETYNMKKKIEKSVRQIQDIKLIKKENKFNLLSQGEREIANLRLKNPDETIENLGKMLKNPISKSGAYHRLENISNLAKKIRKNK